MSASLFAYVPCSVAACHVEKGGNELVTRACVRRGARLGKEGGTGEQLDRRRVNARGLAERRRGGMRGACTHGTRGEARGCGCCLEKGSMVTGLQNGAEKGMCWEAQIDQRLHMASHGWA
eukprot:3293696-Pleurochrysis_carterae.AAC.5